MPQVRLTATPSQPAQARAQPWQTADLSSALHQTDWRCGRQTRPRPASQCPSNLRAATGQTPRLSGQNRDDVAPQTRDQAPRCQRDSQDLRTTRRRGAFSLPNPWEAAASEAECPAHRSRKQTCSPNTLVMSKPADASSPCLLRTIRQQSRPQRPWRCEVAGHAPGAASQRLAARRRLRDASFRCFRRLPPSAADSLRQSTTRRGALVRRRACARADAAHAAPWTRIHPMTSGRHQYTCFRNVGHHCSPGAA